MRLRALTVLVVFASACEPPNILLNPQLPASETYPTPIEAVVTYPGGAPFNGTVEFDASRGDLIRRVKTDDLGRAVTSLNASAGAITVTAKAGGATESLDFSIGYAPTRTMTQPPPPLYLTFRASAGATQTNSPLRPAPVVELVGLPAGSSGLRDEVEISVNVTSCSAVLDPQSQLTVGTLSGLAIFENVVFTTPASGCQLVATTPGVRFTESARFDVVP